MQCHNMGHKKTSLKPLSVKRMVIGISTISLVQFCPTQKTKGFDNRLSWYKRFKIRCRRQRTIIVAQLRRIYYTDYSESESQISLTKTRLLLAKPRPQQGISVWRGSETTACNPSKNLLLSHFLSIVCTQASVGKGYI